MKKADAKKTESNPPRDEKDAIRSAVADPAPSAADVEGAAGSGATPPLQITLEQLTSEQLAELKARAAKADEHWERLLRTAADFENFKKRAARERQEAAQSATAGLVHKLLPVIDHFEMAQTAAQNAQAPQTGMAALQSGIAMIQQQLKGILAETGVEEIDAAGQPFDPMLHEAVSQFETADVPDGHVIQQIRKGYKIRERLLRPATVIVAKNPSSSPEAPPAA